MAFYMSSSPHSHNRKSTSVIMMTVILSTLPGVAALCYFFSVGVLFQIALATTSALVAEIIIVLFRQRSVFSYLKDYSTLLTGLLIGIALPPLAPWWIPVIGGIFAIVIAKHLYGGLGQNPFNPAMIAYVVLLIAFPVQMTSWLPPSSLLTSVLTTPDIISTIFTGFSHDGYSLYQLRLDVDGMTMATPLDTMKTAFLADKTATQAFLDPIFGTFVGHGWGWVNLAFLFGGVFMLKLNIIRWQIPASMLLSLTIFSLLGYFIAPDAVTSPLLHLFSGATMLGAFYIATDPVTAPTTPKGRIVFGAMIGALIYLIRTFGGFPEGIAFAVILANMCVPLIDHYSKPTIYGMKESK